MKNRIKRLSLIPLVLLFLLPGCSPEPVTVHCITGIQRVQNGEEKQPYKTFTYDENGNLIQVRETRETLQYTYDDRGNLLSSHIYRDSLQWYEVYTYDEENNRITRVWYAPDGTWTESESYTYDAHKTADSSLVDTDLPAGWREDCTYDDRGNLLDRHVFGESLQWYELYTYDENDNRITQKKYDPDGTLTAGYSYTYDDQGRRTANISVDQDGEPTGWRMDRTYDASGRLLSVRYSNNGEDTACEMWTYDENGNLTQESQRYFDQALSSCTYIYDSEGRLLTRRMEGNVVVTEYAEYSYDPQTNTVIERYGKKPDALDRRRAHTFDGKGNLIESALLRSDGTPANQRTLLYDEEGKILSRDYIQRGVSESHTTWTYDERGNVLTEKYSSVDSGRASSSEDEWGYDQYGNLNWHTNQIGSNSGTRFTYEAFVVSPEQAQKVLAQQEELLQEYAVLGWYGFEPKPLQMVEYMLEQPEPDRIFPDTRDWNA